MRFWDIVMAAASTPNAVSGGADVTAPTITSASAANCAENATLAHALTANESVTWSITGGADQARFEISGSTLRWASNGTKNFEAPNDANTDNAYVVQVTATDAATNASNQTVTITVTNVFEVTLAALSLDDLTIAEDQSTGTKVGSIINASSGSTITLHAQSDAGMFAKDGNDIEVGATPLDFETVPSPTITLRETHADASNSPRDTVIEITVTDVAEGDNLITNGGFDTDTDWTPSNDDLSFNVPTISGGQAHFTGSTHSNTQALTGAVPASPAGDYEVTLDTDVNVTVFLVNSGITDVGQQAFSPGTAVTHVISASDEIIYIRLAVALEDGAIDNVSMIPA